MRKKLSLDDLQRLVLTDVDRSMRRLFSRERRRAAKLDPELLVMVNVLADLCLRGGKRLRPLLACVGAVCHDPKADLAPILGAGAALELLQTYLLVHDDWMDQDATRRGGPTAHVLFERHHRSSFLGERAAILTGDYAISLAQAELAELDIDPKRLRLAFQAFAQMQIAAVSGQRLDLLSGSDPELTYDLKTASYTVLGPLEVGAALAGSSAADLRTFRPYARAAGIAFQLRDDLLNAFGDPAQTGKPRGSDLTQGKRTPLLSEAIARLRGRARKDLTRVVGDSNAGPEAIEAALSSIRASGAPEAIEARIELLTKKALSSLEKAKISPAGRALLAEATHELVRRKS